jgi:HK97 gp10 family phage protein
MSAVIIGLPQAMANVAAIPVVVAVSGEVGLTAGKLRLVARARSLAPKRTGRMASRIVPVPEGVAAVEDYSRFVERGTVHMRAQPFLGAAFDQESDAIVDLVTNTVRIALYAL